MDRRGRESQQINQANESARQVAAFLSQSNEKQLLHEKDFETLDSAMRKKGFFWRFEKFSRFLRARFLNNPRSQKLAYLCAGVVSIGLIAANPEIVSTTSDAAKGLADDVLAANGVSIKRISVNGEDRIPDTRIIEIVSEDPARSLLFFDVIGAREKLLALPNMTAVSIRKSYPHTLSVTMKESRPFALWQDEGRFFVIDQDGTIISSDTKAFVDALGTTPVFVGDGANNRAAALMAMLEFHPTIVNRIGAAQRVSDRRWRLHTKNAMQIELPEDDVRRALDELASLDRDYQVFDRAIAVLDMRLPDRLSLVLEDTALAASLIGHDE